MDKDDAADDYLLPGEAAKLLHVSRKTLARWAGLGLVPCIVTLGGHRRFRRADVDALLEAMNPGKAQAPNGEAEPGKGRTMRRRLNLINPGAIDY